MMHRTALGIALAALLLTSVLSAQALPVAEWSFDDGVGEWTSLDPTGRVSATTDANVVRENGGGCLEFAYTPQAGSLTGALVPTPGGLPNAQSVRFWLKTSEYAWATVLLAETDGSAYIATFSSLPGTWQEVALGLGEFQLMDSTQDEDQKLDPQQVAALGFGDVVFLLDTLAKTTPFIMAPDMDPRMLWLDDVKASAEPVPPRWEVTQVDGKRAVRLDSFEGAPLQWLTLAGTGFEVTYDREHASDGEFSLRMSYNLPEGKTFGAVTAPADAPLAGMKALRMSMISETATVLLIELKERDESKYHASVQVTGGSQFQEVEVPLSDFALSDDSTDENGALDIDRINELLIADVSIIAGTPGNTRKQRQHHLQRGNREGF